MAMLSHAVLNVDAEAVKLLRLQQQQQQLQPAPDHPVWRSTVKTAEAADPRTYKLPAKSASRNQQHHCVCQSVQINAYSAPSNIAVQHISWR
jgi:hypothetical protein